MDAEVEVVAQSSGSPSENRNFPTLGLSIELLSKEETTVEEIKEKLEPLCRYSVTSEQEVQRLREDVIRILEKPVRAGRAGGTILHSALGVRGSDEPDIYGTLLATGINPDVLSAKGGCAPLHVAAARARPKCVQLMRDCRASPILKDHDGKSALDCSKRQLDKRTGVSGSASTRITEEDQRDQFLTNAEQMLAILSEWMDSVQVESLASLAKRGQFYAVQNLIRRGLFALSPAEFKETFDGKTAQEWTLEHGRKDIADEIAFWTSRAENIRSVIDVDQVVRDTFPADLPDFQRPGNLPLYQASGLHNRADLIKALKPFTIIPITTREHYRKFWEMVIDPFESELDSEKGNGAAVYGAERSMWIDEESYGVLLAMGIDPDRPNAVSLRPSHMVATWASSPLLELLVECRVDLEAEAMFKMTGNKETAHGFSVMDAASFYRGETNKMPWNSQSPGGKSSGPTQKQYQAQLTHTIDVLCKAIERRKEEGPESLASLARRGRFFSIQNLMRRPGFLKRDEFDEEHHGLTVQEWAIEHGRSDIVAEIGFWKTYTQEQESFPGLFNPPHPELRKGLGFKVLWSELRRFVQPYATRPVTCEEEDAHLSRVQEVLEERSEETGLTIVHNVLNSLGGDDSELLGMMAATGFNLDITELTGNRFTPLSTCAAFTRTECFKVLLDCRVKIPTPGEYFSQWNSVAMADMCLKSAESGIHPQAWTGKPETQASAPDQEALLEKAKLVKDLLEDARSKLPDSFVMLAERKAFAAVQHLMRKRPSPITLDDYLETHLGRTAERWAEIHGRPDIATEIRYRKQLLMDALDATTPDKTPRAKSDGNPIVETKIQRVPVECDWREAFRKTVQAVGLTSVAQLGEPVNLPFLREILAKFEDVSVKSPQDDAQLKRISTALSTATHQGETIVQKFLSGKGNDSYDELFGKLLALGIEPDRLDLAPKRPAIMECILYATANCLRRLHLCRIDVFCGVFEGVDSIEMLKALEVQALEVRDNPKSLPPKARLDSKNEEKMEADTFRKWNINKMVEKRQVMLDFLVRAKSEPQPSLVKLAKEREFDAVRSILRRGVLDTREYSEMIEGKNAGMWAFAHGVEAVGDEIYYRESMLSGRAIARKGMKLGTPLFAPIPWNQIRPSDANPEVPPDSLFQVCKGLEDFSIVKAQDAEKLKEVIQDFPVDSWLAFKELQEVLEGDKDGVFSQFLAVGFNPDVKICPEGWTPLEFCAEELKLKCLRLALLCGTMANSKLNTSGESLAVSKFELLQKGIREQTAGSLEILLLEDARKCAWEYLLKGIQNLLAKFTCLRNPIYSKAIYGIAVLQLPSCVGEQPMGETNNGGQPKIEMKDRGHLRSEINYGGQPRSETNDGGQQGSKTNGDIRSETNDEGQPGMKKNDEKGPQGCEKDDDEGKQGSETNDDRHPRSEPNNGGQQGSETNDEGRPGKKTNDGGQQGRETNDDGGLRSETNDGLQGCEKHEGKQGSETNDDGQPRSETNDGRQLESKAKDSAQPRSKPNDDGEAWNTSIWGPLNRLNSDKALLSEFQCLLKVCGLKEIEWRAEKVLSDIASSAPEGVTSKPFSEQVLVEDQDFLEAEGHLTRIIKELEEYLTKKSKARVDAGRRSHADEENSSRNEGSESTSADVPQNDAEILLETVCEESRKFLRILRLMAITNILESAGKRCPISLAELAKHRRFAVILNKIRRIHGDMAISEFFEEFDGATAFEWARKAARNDIAMEIRFWQYYEIVGMITKGIDFNFSDDDGVTGLTLKRGKWDKKTLELIMDFLLWLTLENPLCLTQKVKRHIESKLPRWLTKSGRFAASFLREMFDHIYCQSMPGRRETHDHDPQLQCFINLAQEVHGARRQGFSTKSEFAWLLFVLATQILTAPAPRGINSQMATSMFQVWLGDPRKYGFQIKLFAELVDACWMWIEPDDWPLVDQFHAKVDKQTLGAATTLRGSKVLFGRILRLGLVQQLPASCQNMEAISSEVFWKLVQEETDDVAIGVLRKGCPPFEGVFEILKGEAPKEILNKAQHIAFIAERALLLQRARQAHSDQHCQDTVHVE